MRNCIKKLKLNNFNNALLAMKPASKAHAKSPHVFNASTQYHITIEEGPLQYLCKILIPGSKTPYNDGISIVVLIQFFLLITNNTSFIHR